jgi:hypothetical protein
MLPEYELHLCLLGRTVMLSSFCNIEWLIQEPLSDSQSSFVRNDVDRVNRFDLGTCIKYLTRVQLALDLSD